MTDREKLIELLKAADRYEFEETRNSGVYDKEAAWGYIADYLLAHGVTFQKWIPVTERLPKDFVSVIIFVPSESPLPIVKEAYRANECWATKMQIFFDEEVTHWMPLPEGPKGE